MLSLAIAFLIIEMGSFSLVCACRLRHGEALPLTCMGMVLTMFLGGVADVLRPGALAMMGLIAAGFVCTLLREIRGGRLKEALKRFFTPAGILFMVGFWALAYLNAGWRAYHWDEFSHWADVVKMMTEEHVLSTSPLSHSMFQSYPPAMALFQYFFQLTNQLFMGTFSEWRIILAAQVLILSLCLPFLSRLTLRKPVACILSAIALFAALTVFSSDIFSSVYIDCFVGILSAAGFAALLRRERIDAFTLTMVCLVCAMLVLAKDVGMMFAVFLAVACACRLCLQRGRRGILLSLIPAAGILLPKLLWKQSILRNGAEVQFSAGYDPGQLWAILTGQDTGWRSGVFPAYFQKLFGEGPSLGVFRIPVSMGLCALLLTLGVWGTALLIRRGQKNTAGRWILPGLVTLLSLLYLCGLPVIYIFQFSELQALQLASMDRYVNILLVCLFMTCVLGLLSAELTGRQAAASLAVLLLITSWSTAGDFLSGAYLKKSYNFRKKYDGIVTTAQRVIGNGEARVALVAQGSRGFEHYVLRYCLRPLDVDPDYLWSVGPIPASEGDVWTRDISPDEWRAYILDRFDYVIVYNTDDYFTAAYTDFFSDSLTEKTLYRVDRELGRCCPVEVP